MQEKELLEERFDKKLDTRLKELEERFDKKLDTRLKELEEKFDKKLEVRLKEFKEDIISEISKEFKAFLEVFERVEGNKTAEKIKIHEEKTVEGLEAFKQVLVK